MHHSGALPNKSISRGRLQDFLVAIDFVSAGGIIVNISSTAGIDTELSGVEVISSSSMAWWFSLLSATAAPYGLYKPLGCKISRKLAFINIFIAQAIVPTNIFIFVNKT